MAELKCKQCGGAIRSLATAQYLWLRQLPNGDKVEEWCHDRCLRKFNDEEEYSAEKE